MLVLIFFVCFMIFIPALFHLTTQVSTGYLVGMPEIPCAYKKIVSVTELHENEDNPNMHPEAQIDAFIEGIEYLGWIRPIIISNQSGEIVSGNGRLRAAIKAGWDKVPVDYQDFESPDHEYAAVVSDNELQKWSRTDLAKVNLMVPKLGIPKIELLGIKGFKVDPSEKDIERENNIPNVGKSICQKGDLWKLGEHRLLCGDCTIKNNIDLLMDSEKADMVYTDPPYGFGYVPELEAKPLRDGSQRNKNNHRVLANDSGDWDYSPGHILEYFSYCKEIFLWGADYYCWELPKKGGWQVWDKTGGHKNMDKTYMSSFELCWSKQGHTRHVVPITWIGCFGHDRKNDGDRKVHPTQKPVKLGEWFLDEWSKPGQTIVDIYLGSGSTLIACEKTNRKCYGMEIDPHYCSVIIKRWEEFTGKKAEKISSP